jgi:hypothetical protein
METNKEVAATYPVLTTEEKLSIREAQFMLVNTHEQALAEVRAAEKNLRSTVEGLAKKYSLDEAKTNFNLGTLAFTAR